MSLLLALTIRLHCLTLRTVPTILQRGGRRTRDISPTLSCLLSTIKQMESKLDVHKKKKCPGIVDLMFFDGASNVQNAGEIMKIRSIHASLLAMAQSTLLRCFFLMSITGFPSSRGCQTSARRSGIYSVLSGTAQRPCLKPTVASITMASTLGLSSPRNAGWLASTLPFFVCSG